MASQPGLSYTESFADIANWTNAFASGTGANRWSSVAINATGTIPSGTRITTATATFVTGSSGGVQRGTQNIQLLTTGATDNTSSCAIDFFMDFTGVAAGTVSFDWASVNNSTGNRSGSLRVYTSTDGSSWNELSGASTLDFLNNSPTSGSITAVALPAAFNNSATARLRFYYHNGVGGTTGSRPKVSIDNLNVTAVGGCGFSLGSVSTSCDANTAGIDTYTLSIPYTGSEPGVVVTNTSGTGTLGGDDPSTQVDGIILVSGITEGTSYGVTFSSTCSALNVSGSSPTCDPLCGVNFGTAVATCNTITAGPGDTYNVSIPYTGVEPGVTVVNNSASGTIAGDDPSVVSGGTILITGIDEGDNYSITLSAPCASEIVSGNAPVCEPLPLAAWDFNGEGNPGVATSVADIYNAGLDASNLITRGATAAASGANNSFRTTGFQDNGISTSNTDYFEVTLSAAPGSLLSLTSIDANLAGTASYTVSPGVSNQFAYSLDGTNFTLIGSPTVTIGTPASIQVDLGVVPALQNVSAGTTITLRFYASGQTTSGGWGFISSAPGVYGLAIDGTLTPVGSCTLSLGAASTSCDASTMGVDTYTLSIPYTGSQPGVSVVNNSGSGTIGGDDPSSVSDGIILVSGITEGTGYDVELTAPCEVLGVSGSSPTCEPACEVAFGTATANCTTVTFGTSDTYSVSIPYTGSQVGVTVINNSASGSISGDDPAVTTDGTIVISGINETDTYSITLSAPCGAIVAAGSAPNCTPGPIAAWDFTGENNVATSVAEVYNGDLDASNEITRGAGAAGSAGANSFRTIGFQNNGISTANADYFQVTLSAAPGNTLSLRMIDAILNGTSGYAATPGVSNQFAYSLDGSTFTLIGSPTVTIGQPVTMPTIDLSGISELQNVGPSTTITLRYYASGQTATGGWGFFSGSAGAYGLAIRGLIEPVAGCDINLGSAAATCNTITAGSTDTYDVSIPYTGVQAGISVINNSGSGTIGGDDPAVTADGTIIISGISENDAYSVALSGDCSFASVSGPAPDCDPLPTLVINEVDYDMPGDDLAEFIELMNVGEETVNLNGIKVVLVNGGNGLPYAPFITLGNVDLAPGAYYVIGSANVPNVDLVVFNSTLPVNTNLAIQNGAPDGIRLTTADDIILDQMSYEGAMTTTEGNSAPTDNGSNASLGLSRIPNGTDTDDNSVDFVLTCITPGEANGGVDSDEDGTPDCIDLCPGGPEPGTACDDGDDQTADDVIQGDCSCAGTPVDCEGTPGGAALPGEPCDDFNPATIDDVYQLDCTCAGVQVDCLGIPGGPNLPGAPCNDFIASTNDETWQVDCSCVGTPCSQNVLVDLRSDANSDQISWEILYQNDGTVVCSGGSYLAGITDPIVEACCLPIGCFRLRVYDSGGDGFVTGGYQLRESGGLGRRIIDNLGNFTNGSVSAISSTYENGAFCVPIGDDKLIFSSCDKLDWVANKFIVASANPAVSAEFGVTNSTSGYEFWFYDPNGSFSYRRFRSHATSDGFGTGATRACHFKVNGWFQNVNNPHLPADVLLNVRIRGRVAGTNLPFGQACLFKIDPVLAACPRVKLQDDPANTNDFSCGVIRNFGGVGNAANRIYANPPQPIPSVSSANVRYQFRFRIPGENICIVRPPQTSAQLTMNWTTGQLLECSKTYEVDVRVSLNGGATWCFGPATSDAAAACADMEAWGKVCSVTINPCAMPNGGGNSMVLEANNNFTMYPNPNRGDQLFLSVSRMEDGVSTVSVDIFDMTGKRVVASTIAVQDGFINTNLELNSELAAGLYMVNVTAGNMSYTERLVIQP